MSCLINPFRFGIPYGTVQPAALASRSSTASFADGATVTFNNEVYDNETAFAPTSGSIVIPSAGLYRIGVGAAMTPSAGYRATKTQKGGVVLAGGYGASCETSSPRWHSGWSAPLSLAASDAISLLNNFGTCTYGADGTEYTWFNIERLPQALDYALVRKSADQTSFTSGNVSFNTEIADTLGWHDPVTNNERLTVPSGITRVRLTANIVTGSFSGQAQASITKNGSADVVGCPSQRVSGTGNKLLNLSGPPINVSPTDYFAIDAVLQSSSSIVNEEFTWFAIESVPSAVKSSLVYNSAGHSLTTTDVMLGWDSEDHDTDGMHSTVSNTSRLTVPVGVTRARLFWHIKGQSGSTATIQGQIKKNNASVIGTGIDARPGLAGQFQRLNGASAWLAVTPGDYFELQARVTVGSITTAGGWFAMECE